MPVAEVTIESIAAGGDGVGRVDGRVVFVPRSAPGDVGVLEMPATGRFARAEFRELRTPSPLRVQPSCMHYVVDRCGGCQLQHLAYDAQLEAKGRIVRDAMQRIGRRSIDVPFVRASPHPWRYRRKLTLALRRRRGGWIAGLHPFDDPRRVFSLEDCPITHEDVLSVWREVLAAGRHLPQVQELRGAVRLDDDDSASLTVEGGRAWTDSDAFFGAMPRLATLWWVPEGQGRRRLHTRREDSAPGASFAQVNPAVARGLQERVIALTTRHQPTTVVDAYAGLGQTAIALAGRGMRLTAIELDRDASAWTGARLPDGSRAIAARVEAVLAEALPADVVILNPPRAGVDARVTQILESARPAPTALIYVSCDPATLARDVGRLPSYRIASIESFDMFPQTAHVETICELLPGTT
ncbi:MAG TPA: TRAM domain-containing protein [Gemmatimonadaceae bacterium]|nr:TRAM domain-containing protein [Gemmatimonadaceae bacterium]